MKKLIFAVVGVILVFISFYIGINRPEIVIEDSFRYENSHNKEDLAKCYVNGDKIDFSYIDSIKKIELKDLKRVKDNKEYDNYLKNAGLTDSDISRENIVIFNVKYDVEVKANSKTYKEKSGTYNKKFIVTREGKLTGWKIKEVINIKK